MYNFQTTFGSGIFSNRHTASAQKAQSEQKNERRGNINKIFIKNEIRSAPFHANRK